MIEHFGGAFPLWLSPEQVRVLPISEKSSEYAHNVLTALKIAGIRATLDDSDGRIQAKIKHAAELRIPYLAVVGPRDAENNQVSIRARGVQKDLGALRLDEFIQALTEERESKGESSVQDRFTETANA